MPEDRRPRRAASDRTGKPPARTRKDEAGGPPRRSPRPGGLGGSGAQARGARYQPGDPGRPARPGRTARYQPTDPGRPARPGRTDRYETTDPGRPARPGRGASPGGRDRTFPPGRSARAGSRTEGRDGAAPVGGWDRPGPRRDRPERRPFAEGGERAAGRRDTASSLPRAATTGRNLWPRPPRAPQVDRRSSGAASRKEGPPAGGRPRRPVSARHELGGEQVEGRQAVRELLAAHRRQVREIWMMEGSDPAPILREIENLARSAHVPLRLVGPRQIQQAQGSEAPQGVIAFAQPLREADLSEICSPARRAGGQGPAFVLVVDGVSDPQNLGALLRSAECAGVTGVVLARHRSAHVTATVTKVAAGAVEHVAIAVVAGIPSAVSDLSRLGVWTVGLDGSAPEVLFDLSLGDRPLALVVGAEGRGLSPLVRRRCDVLARIPLNGALDSLNVSAAGAVALFEVARQRALGAAPPG